MKPLPGNGQLLCDGTDFEKIPEKTVADSPYDYFCCCSKEESRLGILLKADGDRPDGSLSSMPGQQLIRNPNDAGMIEDD